MSFTTRPELRGTFGMVASTHWLASAAGMAVLEQGGNAFDAAVAAGFTLQVVEPHLNGPGGDLPALLWPAGADPIVLSAQGPAPRAATIAHYRDDLGLELIPGTGPLAAVVPGSFGGWLTMLRDHGTLPLRDVLRFAIGYAEDGYPMLPQIAGAIRNVERLFRDEWTTSAAVYLPVPDPATLHRNPQLAATYRRILDESGGDIDAALDCWYDGFVADAFLRFQDQDWMDSSGARHRGLLAADDLRDWRPTYEVPVSVDYHGLTVLKAGPWSQGPVFLQQLRLLEGFDLPAMGHVSAEYVHTVTECAKLAFADREAWYGDPEFGDIPIDELLSREYADERRLLVGDESSPDLRPGSPGGREPRLPTPVRGAPVAPGVGEPTRGDTVHVDVVDRFGNMVAATPSGGWLWGAPVIPELGFCLGTRAPDVLARGRAPELCSSPESAADDLSPTLVARDGDPIPRARHLPAATSRTSGRSTLLAHDALPDGPRQRSTPPAITPKRSRAPSIRARRACGTSPSRRVPASERSTVFARAGTTSRRRHRGRSAA
jgi:gamma-glutamyltranspeptidase/glutathione hydrolase